MFAPSVAMISSTVAERLLREMLASVGQNIMYLIWVGLKKEKENVYLSASRSLQVLSFPLVLLLQHLSRGSMGVPVSHAEVTQAWEASAHEEAEGLVQRISLLKGELAEVHQAGEMAEENSWVSSNASVDAERQQEESERECQE
jgi:hypothetical protein